MDGHKNNPEFEDKKENDHEVKEARYIVPPGLANKIEEFEEHSKVAEKEPIMIVGDTGVGKSLFLHIYKKLFREKYSDHVRHPIVEANCAHFGGDLNMVRSELFGHIKGSFTGAYRDKRGLVEEANDGLLILEEIGELPREVQAALLTFIETGMYYKVGESYLSKIGPSPRAKVQVLGATNREDDLRLDFQHRFFPFYVPPLYERRGDILYHLYDKFPEVIRRMAPWEVLALLAHNWPGNVRELNRVGYLMRRREGMKPIYRKLFDSLADKTRALSFLAHDKAKLLAIDKKESSLNAQLEVDLYEDLKDNSIDVVALEKLLNLFNVGLDYESKRAAFLNVTNSAIETEYDEQYEIKIYTIFMPFHLAYNGLGEFCSLFFQNVNSNKHLLDIAEGLSINNSSVLVNIIPHTYGYKKLSKPFQDLLKTRLFNIHEFPPFLFKKGLTEQYLKLFRPLFKYLSGFNLPKGIEICNMSKREREKFLLSLVKEHPNSKFLASLGYIQQTEEVRDEGQLKFASMTKVELLQKYYEGLLLKTEGNKTKAAKIAGEKYSTFIDNLKKFDISKDPKPKKMIRAH